LLALAKARYAAVQRRVGKKAAELWEKLAGVDIEQEKIDFNGPLELAPRRDEVLVAATAFYLNGHPWTEAKQMAEEAYDEADASMKPPYGSVLIDGVVEVLKAFKAHGVKMAIASTDVHRRTAESFNALEIGSYFDTIVGDDDVANGKPAPDMINEILRRTNCKPNEAIMVGDSVLDMQMGKNAKVEASIGVLTGSTKREVLDKLADVVLNSVRDLHPL
jgi:phosphoglycolate phosphatase